MTGVRGQPASYARRGSPVECGERRAKPLDKDPARGLYPPLGRALSDFSMIPAEEPVLLAISGGKDSLLMAYLLSEMRNRSPVKFSLAAITVDPGEPWGFTRDEMDAVGGFLSGLGIPHHVVRTGIAMILEQHPTGKTDCSLCANLRRGALYKAAREMGFRKVALAHHLDDAIETLFLNMFYQSSLRCFEPRTYLSRRQVTVIRPMIYIPERDIAKAAQKLGLPVVTTRCPVAGATLRQSMKELVTGMAREIPGFRNHMRSVLGRVWRMQMEPSAHSSEEAAGSRKAAGPEADGTLPR